VDHTKFGEARSGIVEEEFCTDKQGEGELFWIWMLGTSLACDKQVAQWYRTEVSSFRKH
jgi:hypothetical protein